jgi:hypothetical protein
MQTHDVRFRAPTPRPEPLSVVACSLCLRVLHDSGWIEADRVIRELRTFELPAPIRLEPGLCDGCVELVDRRRTGRLTDPLRAAA